MPVLQELAGVFIEDCRQRVARETALHHVLSGYLWVVEPEE
jgi:hypothetical protein